MPTLQVVNFNIVCAVLGGFITLFGLVSYLVKEKFYMSEALISTVVGIIFSPHATNFIKPLDFANGNEEDLETITLYFTRLVLGVQLVLAGVQLPSKYLKTEWRSMSLLLGPGMCAMWMSTSLLVWALVPNINILFALAVGACVTPTDPVLSNSIVKGKFADKNIPEKLQKIIIAESGANDGLGYPFLFLGLYLVKYLGDDGAGVSGGAGKAMALWFYETWAYEILLSVAYGAVVGWLAKELLHWAEERRYVDRESFLVFAITLALFIVGTAGMLGSDDVLACFIAGNAFTWDDWFRQETEDDSLQPTIDMLLNVSIFAWFGAVCPWHMFVANHVIPIYRLVPLGILVLLLRRLPMVLTLHKFIHQIEEWKHAFFVGFFGPIGVSAIFYLYISREFLRKIEVDGVQREDAAQLSEVIDVVVWFLAICSIFVHGLSIPLGKVGFHLPRTISRATSADVFSRSTSQSRDRSGGRAMDVAAAALPKAFRRRPTTSELGPAKPRPQNGGSVFSKFTERKQHRGRSMHSGNAPEVDDVNGSSKYDNEKDSSSRNNSDNQNGLSPQTSGVSEGGRPEISGPMDARLISRPARPSVAQDLEEDERRRPDDSPEESGLQTPTIQFAGVTVDDASSTGGLRPDGTAVANAPSGHASHRSIRFGDE